MSLPAVPITVLANAAPASASVRTPARAGRTVVRLMDPGNPCCSQGCAGADRSGVVPGLAGHDHARLVALDEHTRLDRPDLARSRARQSVFDGAVLRELLEVLDRREDEHQPVLAKLVERARGTQPARVHALLAVGRGLRALRRARDEEPGVE